jgi:hypothetical protein
MVRFRRFIPHDGRSSAAAAGARNQTMATVSARSMTFAIYADQGCGGVALIMLASS